MHKIIFFIFTVIPIAMTAQEFTTQKLLPPETATYEDLHFLKDEIGEKRLVMLGELTHQFGNIFEMKARVLEYLHKELGYTTLAMESPMYGLWKMNQTTGFTPKAFNDNIFGVWANTIEFQRVVNYINDNTIKVVGFDSQILNTTSFIDDFFDYLEQQQITIQLDEDDFAIVIEGVVDNYRYADDDISYVHYEKEIKRIIKEIKKLPHTDTNYHWQQFVKGLLSNSKDAYYNTEDILTTDFESKQANYRDAQMADNILSYMQQNPSEKIILWADNVHIINNMKSIKKPIIKDFISMGIYIKKELKDQVYSLATIHANDSILDKRIWHKTPIIKGSFEDKLSSIGNPYLFISSSQEAMQIPMQHRLLNFIDFTSGRLDQLHDGYIFIKHATLPKKDRISIIESQNTASIAKKPIPQNLNNEHILKAKIIDSKTNIPVSYATIILKEAEIYRAANDDGYFEIPISPLLIKNGILKISSIGYTARNIPLTEIGTTIKLESNLEQLDEVEIVALANPRVILKKAIDRIKINHPNTPFNSKRYSHSISNKDDSTFVDIELISKEYDQGYRSPFVATREVEQIKWNKGEDNKKYKYTGDFIGGRENAIQYANILHKRKYKKFKLQHLRSIKPEDEGLYIISFKTDRTKWNYTNRSYPTDFSGKIYIDKESYAIVKVVQNWETTLYAEDIEKYKKYLYNFIGDQLLKVKSEAICLYKKQEDQKYYTSEIIENSYRESIKEDGKQIFATYQATSLFFEHTTKDPEVIDFEYYEHQRDKTILRRVSYDKDFWDRFYTSENAPKTFSN